MTMLPGTPGDGAAASASDGDAATASDGDAATAPDGAAATAPDGDAATAASEQRERYANEQRERCTVTWSFDPWSERPAAAGTAALAVLGMWLILAACRFPLLLAVAQGIVVASPLVPAFMPTACRIESDGAARRGVLGWARRSWADVRRIEDVPVGVLLSPYARRHWLDASRGFTLPMPRPRRAELAAVVRECWSAHER